MKKTHLLLAGAAAFAALFGAIGATATSLAAPAKQNAAAASAKNAAGGGEKPQVAFKVEGAGVNRADKGRVTSYADMLARVTPAVVTIYNQQIVRDRAAFDPFEHLFGGPFGRSRGGAPGGQRTVQGLGSGTIIHADGYILTNRHVVSDADASVAKKITVELADKRTFTATVIGSDPRTDIAVLKIEGRNLPVARIADSGALRVGDIVFAVGNPLGVGMTVTSGIVSALGRQTGILNNRREGVAGLENFIQTDAAINPGNSGGPLVDCEGRVVGVNQSISSPNGGNIGIGFAVPTSLAISVAGDLVNDGKVTRGYFGVATQEVDEKLSKDLGLPSLKGALVSEVVEKSPAEKAGIQPGDTIVAVNGETVERPASLTFIVARLKPGAKARVDLYRDGKRKTVTVTVGSRQETATFETLFGGAVEFAELNDTLRERHSIPRAVRAGVVITDLSANSVLAEAGVQPGFVIVAANGRPVSTPDALLEVLRKGQLNRLRLYIPRFRAFRFITIEL